MICRQNPHMTLSKKRRILIFVIGVFESMVFCGAVFGWPQLVYILKHEGIYADLCPDMQFQAATDITTEIPDSLREFDLITDKKGEHSPAIENTIKSSEKVVNSMIHAEEEVKADDLESLPFPSRCDVYNVSAGSFESKTKQCKAQDDRFALVYTLIIGCYSIPGILIGYLLHVAGLRVTRVSACAMLSASFIFLGATTKDTSHFIFPGMILMALGGNQLRMCGMQFGDLFPKHRSTAITFLSGMYATSASLFLVFKYMSDAGIDKAYGCWVLAAISVFLLFSSFLMPLHHIPVHDAPVLDRSKVRKVPPLSTSLWSLSSFLHQYSFFISLFAMNNYQQSYNVWITASACDDEEVNLYSSLFSYSNLFSIFFAPIGGYFTDFMIKKARRNAKSEMEFRVREIQSNFWPLLVTSIAVTGMYMCLFFFHPASIYISLLCMVVARPCIIAISTAYLRIRFHVDHFNRLLGIYGTVTSALLPLQYPHFKWAQNMYVEAHIFSIVMIVLSYSNAFHLLFRSHIESSLKKLDMHGVDDPQEQNIEQQALNK